MSFEDGYTGRDYGSNLRQQRERDELRGLHEDFRDPDYIPPNGVVSRWAMDAATGYPMGSTPRRHRDEYDDDPKRF